MKIRVGVVGPSDSVKQMMEVGEQYKDLSLIPFVYDNTEETEQIIIKNKAWVDQWLFSGQAPYYFALSKGVITEHEATFTPLNGASLLAVLLQAYIKEEKVLKRFSLDTIQAEEIEKGLNPLVDHNILFHLNAYEGYMPAEEMIKFHKKLYESGKVDAAITCLNTVYQELSAANIPVYRIIQSELSLHRSLEHIREKGHVSWYKKSQLVIIGVEMIQSSSLSHDEQLFSFKVKHQVLELKRVLLQVTEEVNGSIVQIGDGIHYIYTTRGELELYMRNQSMISICDEIYIHSKLFARVGVGYGLTVLDAEENVGIAFDHAREKKVPVVVTVNEEKEVTIYLDDGEEISFYTRKYGREWEKIFKDAGISPKIVSKIESLSVHYQKTAITSQDLAHWLKSTDRNARRILVEMERLGLAKVSGEESGHRGRPRKIYELQINQIGLKA
ncbi:hypothetical protein [Cytobacillus purgationiresistens]|uniref:Transcriptional regulator n=1 Tax=Cytobacillus purgationiresistens TaxID=863449 RepID=A0ABU0AAD7_9BACI|nr:hypothetical protein [Cytobacillus purgationiresistens]MDQ0268212.1 hypothetical protein [Cytobacillus purgationiresistens]